MINALRVIVFLNHKTNIHSLVKNKFLKNILTYHKCKIYISNLYFITSRIANYMFGFIYIYVFL